MQDVAQKLQPGQEMDLANGSGLVLSAEDLRRPCGQCGVDARSLLSVIVYARALEAAYLNGVNQHTWSEVAAAERIRVARWRAYHFGNGLERVQLPWELEVNNYVYGRQWRQAEAEARARHEPAPIPEPPQSAITVLHPSIGVTLKDRDGADTTLAGVVELVGYSRWHYDDDNKRSGEWGVSLIAAYQSSDEADDWGYGALVRTPWNNINVAWIRTRQDDGSDDDAVLLSVDIGNLFRGMMGGSNDGACRQGVGACPAP